MDRKRSSRKNSVDYILSAPDKRANETYGPGGLLATLFRNVLATLQITPARWSRRMQEHFDQTAKLNYSTRKDLSGVRANINSALLGDDMTWKSFCKGMVFLHMTKMRITVEFSRGAGNKVHSTSIEVDLGRNSGDTFDRFTEEDTPTGSDEVPQDTIGSATQEDETEAKVKTGI